MLQQKLQNRNVILASQSPRRQELIKGLGIDFEVEVKSVEENYSKDLKREEITNYLAKLKASAFSNLNKEDILITSDTIVWFENEPLEKPKNKEEALKMLQKLSGKRHEVVTSICLTSLEKQKVAYDVTQVFFKEFSLEELMFYIEQFKPFDKAGSYGIQEWLGYVGVEKIEGSYVNVMGLPTHLLYRMLNQFVEGK
ncbi:maf-like protein [Flavobacteriaceae bacterium UJ101]|nr:maf-like protein [Flavobacteriaceae bacterium UJ101]